MQTLEAQATIYFVLPIYNEENNILTIITEIRRAFVGYSYKIMAMNDGSSDGSMRILNELQSDDMIVDGSLINMNIGATFSLAVDRVIKESKNNNDIVVILESDQTSNIGLVHDLIAEIRNKSQDIVVASRYLKGGGYRNFPLLRLIYSRCANGLLKLFFPLKNVTDYTIFLRAYRITIFKPIIDRLTIHGLLQSQGFVANSELLVKCAVFTERISEVPFVYDYGRKIGKSKMNVFRTINEYFVFIQYMKHIVNQLKKSTI